MKKTMLLALALALLPGCSSVLPGADQPPKAYVDVITPTDATEGQTVRFVGHGTDVDGQVVGYSWRSSRDGQLGATAEFETSALSVGNHTIYFSVQDNNDLWSEEVSSSIRVAAAPAPPTIDRFDASLLTIHAGDSVTLAWKVSNAGKVTIDQGIGTVAPEGSVMVSPASTTTYALTATGADATVSAGLTITVERASREVTLTADSEMSGFVRSLGIYVPGAVYVGDDSSDRGIQGFVTFDISCIPDGATITKVSLDLSRYDVPYESPFPGLGCLTAYVHNYTTLYGQYWTQEVPVSITEWCSFNTLDRPAQSSRLLNAVQGRVGKNRFQFRLQFAEGETDENGRNNLLYWSESNLPTMIVEYHT
jgi:hypothetical protein